MLCCLSNFLHVPLKVICLAINAVYSDNIAVFFQIALSTTCTRGMPSVQPSVLSVLRGSISEGISKEQ